MLSFNDNNYMLCIVILFILFMSYYLFLNCDDKIKESFQTEPETVGPINMYLPSIINDINGLINKFGRINLQLILNMLPYNTDLEESEFPTIKKNHDLIFPVHKILITVSENKNSSYNQDFYLIVANDGKLYTHNIGSSLYKGPLKKSIATDNTGNSVPMRIVTIDNNSNVYGIGFDKKLYKKDYDINSTDEDKNKMNLESEWVLSEKIYEDIIYILFINNNNRQNTQNALIIIENGYIYLDNGTSNLIECNIIESGADNPESIKLLKIMYHRSGFLLGIGNDYNLYKSTRKYINSDNQIPNPDQTELNFNFNSEHRHPSEHKFYDFGYDNYGCLKCQVFDTDLAIFKTMVQTDAYFASDFRDINSQDNRVSSNKDIVLSNADIIKYKCGTIIIKEIPSRYGEDNLDEAVIKQNIAENKKLRKFCKKQDYHYESIDKYKDMNMELKVNTYNTMIKELENKINHYKDKAQKSQE